MTTPTLYTMGYLHSSSKRTLAGLIAVRTPLVDIRKSPNSKRIEWDTRNAHPGAWASLLSHPRFRQRQL